MITRRCALLIYLAVERARTHQRDTLAELLWPNQPAQIARTSLRQALAKLRHAIGDQAAEPPFLLITRDTLQFNPASAYLLDTATFSDLVATCARHDHAQPALCSACVQRWEAAIALYRGAFFDGTLPPDSPEFEAWVTSTREWFAQQALEALTHLADHYEQRGAMRETLFYARRQLELDPWRESAHRQIMRMLVRNGDRSAAIAQFEQCRAVLRAELGIAPEPATSALYQQLCASASEFASVSVVAPAAKRYPLPLQPTTFIGREAELAEIGGLLREPGCRLISVLGPGGIGKTRLALQSAAMYGALFADGACWVPLQALHAPEYLIDTLAHALGCALEGADNPRAQLLDWLAPKHLLLLLDTMEHLLAAADLLVDLLSRAPRVTLLLTTRERLNLRWEWLFDIEGLSFPLVAGGASDRRYDAIRLFSERARQARRRSHFAPAEQRAIVQICQAVEGMPLALEMAAAASREHALPDIAQALTTGIDTLRADWRDLPARHRSVQVAFEHSWQLLGPHEQAVLARLAVFQGGFDAEAAAHVSASSADLLAGLVGKSLLRAQADDRYALHELIRQFARTKLCAVGMLDSASTAHLDWYAALAEAAEPQLHGAAQDVWMQRLARDIDNLRAALGWACDHGAGERAARLASALWRFWWMRGHLAEGRRWLERVLVFALPSALRVKAVSGAGALAFYQSDLARARQYHQEALELTRALGDQPEIARTLDNLGLVLNRAGEYDQARALFEESLAIDQALGDTRGMAFAFGNLAETRYFAGDYAEAARLYAQSLNQHRALGDQHSIAISLTNLGEMQRLLGDLACAEACFAESVAVARQIDASYILAVTLNDIGHVRRDQGDHAGAQAAYAEALPLLAILGEVRVAAEALTALAGLAPPQFTRAATLLGCISNVLESSGVTMEAAHQAAYQQTAAVTRAALAAADWDHAWAAGRAMTLEQAARYATAVISA